MKKITLIVAAAALLSGGVFVKVKTINDVLMSNIDALSSVSVSNVTEAVYYWWEAPGLGYGYAMRIDEATIEKRHKVLQKIETHECFSCSGCYCTDQQYTKETEWFY